MKMTFAQRLLYANFCGVRPLVRRLLTYARLSALAALLTGLSLPFTAWGQSFPSKPIRVIVPFPAVSSPDVIARFWGDRLYKTLGQPVLIDNRPGASTIIGTQAVATAAADGYTLLFTAGGTTSINPHVFKALPYKVEDFTPVVRVVSFPFVLVVSGNSPLKTSQDLLLAAKERPGNLNYASYGIATPTHVAMARFLNAAGVTMTHVPYRDGGIADLISGTIAVSFEPATTATPFIKSGRLRGLAVTGSKRLEVLPDVPAVRETIPGFVVDAWLGILAPKATPAEAVSRLAAASQTIIQSGEFRDKANELGLLPVGGTPAEFQRFMTADSKVWEKVVKDNDIKVD